MNNQTKYKGKWFLPINEDEVIDGELTISNNSILLELSGMFSSQIDFTKNNYVEIIHGKTNEGFQITLYRCLESFRNIPHGGTPTSNYRISTVINGEWFSSEIDLRFKSIISRFSSLNNWINRFGYDISSNKNNTKVTVVHKVPEDINFILNDGIKGSIFFHFISPMVSFDSKVKLEQKLGVELKSENEIPLYVWLEKLIHFNHFLMMGSLEKSGIFDVRVSIKGEDNKERFLQVVSTTFLLQTSNTTSKFFREYFFIFKDLEDVFDRIILKWFEEMETLRPILELLSYNIKSSSELIENNFLNMAQAIETFHSRYKKNYSISKSEYNIKKKEILDSVNPIHKEWLGNILNFQNRPLFQTRILEILEECDFDSINKMISDKLEFSKEVKKNRNYLTHYDQKLENKTLKGVDLYKMTERIKIVLICSILISIGIKKATIDLILKRNEWRLFNHILN